MDNRPSWFVSVSPKSRKAQTLTFIKEGFWENHYSDQSVNLINEIKAGDRIALKTTHNKKERIPFDANGKIVSVMEIKAIGTVTRNYYDGKRLAVNWTPVEERKEWYFFTFIRSIWKIKPNPKNWMTRDLIAFTFYDEPQDIKRFMKEPYWKKRFMKEVLYVDEIVDVLRQLNGEAHLSYIQEEIRKRKKIKNLEKNPNWRAEIRFTLQKFSSDSKSFVNGEDLFYRKSFSSEVWGLREMAKRKCEAYSEETFLAETFLDLEKYKEMIRVLKEEKSIMLRGTVCKSFMAKKLAYVLLKEKEEERILYVDLEQDEVNKVFKKNPDDSDKDQNSNSLIEQCGFMGFCKKASEDHRNDYFFIIDEINRDNLTKNMADLLLLFKKRNRMRKMEKNITKKSNNFIPENLYIIGMMDIGDRCFRLIDEILKQHFKFVELKQAFKNQGYSIAKEKTVKNSTC
ncbi:hypothetical protein [Acetobacterium carbinolicum]|uniref:hypothetical protein n=1 Tax=Acetobacterium carbinolicum TaxID=52690 RepID=UPI0039C9C5B6